MGVVGKGHENGRHRRHDGGPYFWTALSTSVKGGFAGPGSGMQIRRLAVAAGVQHGQVMPKL
jgi:hypothetical protein